MTTSGFFKMSGLIAGLILAGIGVFTLRSTWSSGTPGGQITAPIKALPTNDTVKSNRNLNEIAMFLAGIQDSQGPEDFQQMKTDAWKAFSGKADSNWSRFSRRKLVPVHNWREKEIPRETDTITTLFYPFGGPDFIFANAFFPKAKRYILFGLESPGKIPDIATWQEQNLKSSLAAINKSIEDVTSVGFFRTNDMKVELASSAIDGVTPLLMLFIIRSGHTITGVTPGELTAAGDFQPLPEFQNLHGEKAYGTAVEIRFKENASGEAKSLIYFSTDVSDEGLDKNPGCKNFIDHVPANCITLIKSASYLMHLSAFTFIRKAILAKSRLILQDDSGIPYRSFKQQQWQLRLYGTYSRTIDLFKHKYQDDLKEAYEIEENPRAVPFKIGYNIKFNETNLQMAIRKDSKK